MNVRAILASAPNPDKILRVARSWAYPKQIVYFIVSFIALLFICHHTSLAYAYFSRRRVSSTAERTSVSYKRLPLAIHDSVRALAFRWTIPIGSSFALNLFEFVVTTGYVVILLSWTLINTTTVKGIKFEPHYYANRAGTVAGLQLPILAALGMRNNIIAVLTGISFDKINLLHRVAARAVCILGWMHAGGHIHLGFAKDEKIATEPWMQCGALALTAFTLLCLLTIRPIRQRNYEFFIVIHFFFVFIFLMAIYFHFQGRNLTHWGVYPAMIVWAFDRLLSVLRIIVLNFAYFNPFSSSSSKEPLNAQIDVISANFLRISFTRSKHFHWRPGQSAFLCFPTISKWPWESHPFTISSIPDPTEQVLDGIKKEEKKLTFLLRVHKGVTAKLLKVADPDKTFPVFINGPYSSPPRMLGYNTVILIAGGSGISFTLPFLLDLITRAKRGDPSCQRLVFIWAFRDAAHIQWISSSLDSSLKDLPSTLSISIDFYLTSSDAVADDASSSHSSRDVENDTKEKDSKSREKTEDSTNSIEVSPIRQPKAAFLDLPFVSLERGRPNIKAIMSDEIARSAGRLSLNVCGPHDLMEAAREAVRNPRPLDILRGGPTVTLHVEGF